METGFLVVRVSGIEPRPGDLKVAVFASPGGFPGDYSSAVRGTALAIGGPSSATSFDLLPPGKYAVSVLHDENANARMDRGGWPFRLPAEGYGVSGRGRRKFAPPSFDLAVFKLDPPGATVFVEVVYPRP